MDGIQRQALACDMTALDAAQRARRHALAERLHAALREVREHPDGYALRYPPTADLCLAVAEFIMLERLCCPFFGFTMEVEPNGGPLWLRLSGPDGVKAFVREEVGLATVSR